MEDLGLLSPPMRRAWALVEAHLDADRIVEAELAAVTASAATEWERFGQPRRFGGPLLYRSDAIPLEWCWFEPGETTYIPGRVLLTTEAMVRFGNTGAVARFTNGLATTMSAPGFRRYSLDSWTDLLPASFR